jgi:hypothetical protein
MITKLWVKSIIKLIGGDRSIQINLELLRFFLGPLSGKPDKMLGFIKKFDNGTIILDF